MSKHINTKEELEIFVAQNWDNINHYLDQEMSNLPVPFYTSVDIRESKNKFAPVDNNIYPAGFNNLCQLDLEAASEHIAKILQTENAPQHIGIIPESHTKNAMYLDHLAILGRTIRDAGFNVYFLGLDPELFESNQNELNLVSHSGFDITINAATLEKGCLWIEQDQQKIKMNLLILNNDQSSPLDFPWQELTSPVLPTPNIGWFARKKSTHFHYYHHVLEKFGEHFSIGTNLLEAQFKSLEGINFQEKSGLDQLALEVQALQEQLANPNAHIFIKASQGTYGMGISVVQSAEEVLQMNRKTRNKMDVGKNKIKFDKVLIQESVDTILKYDNMPAEVTLYLIQGRPVGGFMRANSQRDEHSNLNSRGMVFKKFCISEIRQNQDHKAKEATYSIIARLSTWASAFEIQDVIA